MKKPNFFIIGAPKCGTTTLASYLSEHPEIYFSIPKEPSYWCDDLGVEPHAWCFDSLAKYSRLFDDVDSNIHKVIAEGTTSYLRSKNALKRILDFNSSAKFLVMLRNPVDVAHAYHMEQLYTGLERERSFSVAWELQKEREMAYDQGRLIPNCDSLLYARISLLGNQVKRAMGVVPREQLKIVYAEDFRHDPKKVYIDVLSFLNLSYDNRLHFSSKNVAHVQRYPCLSHFLLNPPRLAKPCINFIRFELLKRNLPGVKWLKSKLNVKQPRERIPNTLRRRMINYYEKDIKLLSKITGRNLDHWIDE